MRAAVFDLEADGLLNMVDPEANATRIWCGVFKEWEGKVYKYPPERLGLMLEHVVKWDMLIGHNIIDYDIEALERLYGVTFPSSIELVDTYLLSQMLWPDKMKHPKCSPKVQSHSLENWGWCFGIPKPEHEDWSKYSSDMMHRCTQDVEINYKLFEKINKEVGFL